jgi:hypothetical protein
LDLARTKAKGLDYGVDRFIVVDIVI